MGTKKRAARAARVVSAPLGTATVTTPETPQRPTGYLWARLDAATSAKDLDALEDHATVHGYAPEGQLMRAIAEKRTTLRRK